MTSNDNAWYVGLILYESSSNSPTYEPLYEESFVLISANSEAIAKQKIISIAKKRETSFENINGEMIKWKLNCIIDVNQIPDNTITDGSEIYSRHFRNYKAYREFEPLLNNNKI